MKLGNRKFGFSWEMGEGVYLSVDYCVLSIQVGRLLNFFLVNDGEDKYRLQRILIKVQEGDKRVQWVSSVFELNWGVGQS